VGKLINELGVSVRTAEVDPGGKDFEMTTASEQVEFWLGMIESLSVKNARRL
jgi:hypothetical protein